MIEVHRSAERSGHASVRPWFPAGSRSVLPWSQRTCTGCARAADSRGRAAEGAPWPSDLVAVELCDWLLETYYTINDRELYTYRSVSNARSLAWVGPRHAVSPGAGERWKGSLRLMATWLGGSLQKIVAGEFDPRGGWTLDEALVGCSGKRISGDALYPTIASRDDTEAVIAWVEVDRTSYEVCGSFVSSAVDLPGAARVVMWDIGSLLQPMGVEIGVRYPSVARAVASEEMALTYFVGSTGREAWAAKWPGGVVAVPLAYFDAATPYTTDVTSDPSVAASPDGEVVVWAWEEAAVVESGAPPGKRIMFQVRTPGSGARPVPQTWGPYPVFVDTASGPQAAVGQEPCVAVSERCIYLAHHKEGNGGVHVMRLNRGVVDGLRPESYDGTELWAPVALDKVPDAGWIGMGWLPNIAARTVGDEDLIAVVWEWSPDPSLTINENKHVELAFIHYVPGVADGFYVSGTRSLQRSDVSEKRRWQLSPSVAIGPDDLGLGYVPVDVLRYDVDEEATITELRHRRFQFDGDCT